MTICSLNLFVYLVVLAHMIGMPVLCGNLKKYADRNKTQYAAKICGIMSRSHIRIKLACLLCRCVRPGFALPVPEIFQICLHALLAGGRQYLVSSTLRRPSASKSPLVQDLRYRMTLIVSGRLMSVVSWCFRIAIEIRNSTFGPSTRKQSQTRSKVYTAHGARTHPYKQV